MLLSTALACLQAVSAPINAPQYPTARITEASGDWLLDEVSTATSLRQLDSRTLELTNGLLSRVFTVSPDWATWDVGTTQGSALRGMSPEAVVVLDGIEYHVGGLLPLKDDQKTPCPQPRGLSTVPDNCPTAYFNRSTPYTLNRTAFNYVGHSTTAPTAPFPWKPARHAPDVPWPPHGLALVVNFTAPLAAFTAHRGVTVSITYELYSGAPIMTKWLSFHNHNPPAASDSSGGPNAPSNLASDEYNHTHAAIATVPPDQQGPICLQPCHVALPASDWESHWQIVRAPTTKVAAPPTHLKLAGAMAGRNLCLAIVKADQYHGGNDDLDVRPCNMSDGLQQWKTIPNGSICSLSTLSQRKAVGAPANGHVCAGPVCCLDVNNHQADAGTTLQLGGPSLWGRLMVGGGTEFQLSSLTFGNGSMCMWHTPLPPPPPPPPPPHPKLPCLAAAGCVTVTTATIEVLRLNQPWAPTEARPVQDVAGSKDDDDARRQIRTGTGLLFVKAAQQHGSNISWVNDPTFVSAYAGNIGSNEPMLQAGYQDPERWGGPAHRLQPNDTYSTYRVLELWADSTEPERKGLSRRKMTRMLAPQSSEAPLFFHLTDASPTGFRHAIDQMAAVGGFDMLIYSFGSGFSLENTSPTYLSQLANLTAYAKAHGIEVGGYDLISDTRGGTGFDTIDPTSGKPTNNACFASGWNKEITSKVLTQMAKAGISMLETDGPYAGNPCASTAHNHIGAADSVDMQWHGQAQFYSLMRQHNVYVHAPDGYLYDGGANKECGGYEENQMSLPRWQWLSIAHQENYDDLWTETPTQAWMFAPLDDYHAGGAAAALEPFAANVLAWNWTLGTFIGHGRGACYRGDHLFDTPEVQAMVRFWTDFWLKYRSILIQDIIHIRRPDMQQIDSVMHVTANRSATVCALAMFYNPSLFEQSVTLKLPLYYTGETTAVLLEWNGAGVMQRMILARDYSVLTNVTLGPREIGFSVVHRVPSL